MQREGPCWILLLVSVRYGAASLSAAVNSQNRLLGGELRGCPWPPGDRSGQGLDKHLRTTTSSQACMHTGLGTSEREAEGKSFWEETDCRELGTVRAGFNRQLRVQL